MEKRQFQDIVLRCNPEKRGCHIDDTGKLIDEDNGDQGSHHVENEMGQGEPFSIVIGGRRTKDRCNCRADIRTDRQGEGVHIDDLPRCKCRDNNRHRCSTGLYNDGGDDTDAYIGQYSQ